MMTVWQGKALGALIGLMSGGPFGGAMGFLLGHWLDTEVSNRKPRATGARAEAATQAILFRATFQVMAHVAKADGRISEDEIRAARAMMDRMQLDEAQQRFAIELYTAGKIAGFPLQSELRRVYSATVQQPELRTAFLQLQVQAAIQGGCAQGAGRVILQRICDELGLPRSLIERVEGELSGRRAQGATPASSATESLRQAYSVLGLTQTATDAQVTKAYRRLINRHHPDKLQAKGLAESQLQLAAEKTRQVRAAYERIRDARQMK